VRPDRSAGRKWKNALRDVLPCLDVIEERLNIWRKGQEFGRRGVRKESKLRGWRTDSDFNRTG
jgi:hypothetical protein